MRISKLLLSGALAAAVSFSVRADDNAAQAAARAALMQKMNELEGGQPPAAQTPAAVTPITNAPENSMTPPAPETNPAPAPETAAPATEPAPANPPVVETPAETNPAPPAAQMEMTNEAAPAAPVVETPTPVQITNAPEAPVVVPIPPSSPAPVVIATNSADSQAAARAALMQQLNQPPSTGGSPSNVNASGYTPIVAPPPPVNSAQQAQLDALLEQYKADQITPEQYQTERQKILSQP
ncbi:MAG TPA: hypothetical protein VFV23_04680 [Verrucomicrobiae bacterium]|nr:hypothetical protein [Verrucomicrobiae bacterium]